MGDSGAIPEWSCRKERGGSLLQPTLLGDDRALLLPQMNHRPSTLRHSPARFLMREEAGTGRLPIHP